MLLLVEIDLSSADLSLFDNYEAKVLPLLASHDARLLERLRAVDGRSETHLLDFQSEAALNSFLADPARQAMQDLWRQTGASATSKQVVRHG